MDVSMEIIENETNEFKYQFVISKEEYNLELIKMTEVFELLNWTNSTAVMHELTLECNSLQRFYKLNKKLIKSLKWFVTNKVLLENIKNNFIKRNIEQEFIKKINDILLLDNKPNLILISEIIVIKDNSDYYKKSYIFNEWTETLSSYFEELNTLNFDSIDSVNRVKVQNTLHKLGRLLKDEIWSISTDNARIAIFQLLKECSLKLSNIQGDHPIKDNNINNSNSKLFNQLIILYSMFNALSDDIDVSKVLYIENKRKFNHENINEIDSRKLTSQISSSLSICNYQTNSWWSN